MDSAEINQFVNAKIKKMVVRERTSGSKYTGKISHGGIRKSFYGNTKGEVRIKARDWLIENYDKKVLPKKSSITFGNYMQYWLKKYKLNKIEQTSYERLVSVYEHQIKDTIGNIKIGNITTDTLQDLIDGYAIPDSEDEAGLAISGLKKLREQLNACLRIAVKEGVIEENPCELVVLPNKYCVATPTKKQFSLTDQQIQLFKEACMLKYESKGEYRSRDGLVLLIILSLGLRVGEALALEWTDFDTDKMIVRINKTIQTTKKNGPVLKDGAKTRSSIRTIPLNDNIIFYLNELTEYDKRNNIISTFICSTMIGTRKSARNLQRSLDLIQTRTDLGAHVSLHTLRHTFGSCMLRQGAPIEVVSKLMGHSSVKITYDKYIHVLNEQQAMAMKLFTVV